MAICQEDKRHVAQGGGLRHGASLGQVKPDGFFDSLAELVQAPGLGVTSKYTNHLRFVTSIAPDLIVFS